MRAHTVEGGSGVRLHVREWGDPRGVPILLVHGWSQSHLCWRRQYESDLLARFRIVALDLRGHGMSDAPSDPAAYRDGDAWADDLAAVVRELSLVRPILVGWSYGGYVICDFVRRFGDREIGGIGFVAAGVVLGPKAFGPLIGPGFLENAPPSCSPDLPTRIGAVRSFLRACLRRPAPEDVETALAAMMVVPPGVGAALIERELDFTPLLRELAVPVLVSHSRDDTMVLPAMSEHILSCCGSATASWFDGVGHAPFLGEPDRFNRELAGFADRAVPAAGP